jgi:transposase
VRYHANAKLTLRARRELVERMLAGWTAGDVADQMNVSAATVYKWWRRWRTKGDAGLWDRSSRPRSCPTQTSRTIERRIERIRTTRKLGPARIAGIVEMHSSTVHRVLAPRGLSRLAWIDQPTGRVIRRIETSRPGELVHVDTKKTASSPSRGLARGWTRCRCPTRPAHPAHRLRTHRHRRVQQGRLRRGLARRTSRHLCWRIRTSGCGNLLVRVNHLHGRYPRECIECKRHRVMRGSGS